MAISCRICGRDTEPAKDDGIEDFGGERGLFELAAAVRRGDRSEAELWLDRIAEELGGWATEEVQLGRYSPQASA